MNDRVRNNLMKARELIADHRDWGLGSLAQWCQYPDGTHCQHCALGAIGAAVGLPPNVLFDGNYAALEAACRLEILALAKESPLYEPLPGASTRRLSRAVFLHNDSSTHEEVLAWFDRAIEATS